MKEHTVDPFDGQNHVLTNLQRQIRDNVRFKFNEPNLYGDSVVTTFPAKELIKIIRKQYEKSYFSHPTLQKIRATSDEELLDNFCCVNFATEIK